MTKKRILFLSFVLLIFCYTIWYFYGYSIGFKADTEKNTRQKLLAYYNPGTCYGMPVAGGVPQAIVNLKKKRDHWQYEVWDGNCCNIKVFKGNVEGRWGAMRIEETSYKNLTEPC